MFRLLSTTNFMFCDMHNRDVSPRSQDCMLDEVEVCRTVKIFRLLRSLSDSVFQPLHSVVTTNKIYIERCGALSFAVSTVLAVRRRALLRNLLTAVCRIFIEFPASFCYIMPLYRTLVTCSATENKMPGLQY